MADRRLRELERAAAEGGPAARIALHRERLRLGVARVGAEGVILAEPFMADFRRNQGLADLACLPDGRRVVATGNHSCALWDLEAGAEVRAFLRPAQGFAVALSPRGDLVAAASGSASTGTYAYSGRLAVWEVETGTLRFELDLAGFPDAIAWTADDRIVAGCSDRALRVIDPQGAVRATLSTGSAFCRQLAVDPTGPRVLTAGRDKRLRLWDLDAGATVQEVALGAGRLESLAIAPTGRLAISGSGRGEVSLWDLEAGAAVGDLVGHTKAVKAVAFSPIARRALSGGNDGTVRLWDLPTGQEVACFRGHEQWVEGVAFTPDGAYGLSCGTDSTIRRWGLPH